MKKIMGAIALIASAGIMNAWADVPKKVGFRDDSTDPVTIYYTYCPGNGALCVNHEAHLIYHNGGEYSFQIDKPSQKLYVTKAVDDNKHFTQNYSLPACMLEAPAPYTTSWHKALIFFKWINNRFGERIECTVVSSP